jgi:hypothetical protein
MQFIGDSIKEEDRKIEGRNGKENIGKEDGCQARLVAVYLIFLSFSRCFSAKTGG